MSEFIGLRWNYWNLSKHKDFKLIYSFCKENLNLKQKVKTFYLVLLYELIYEIWIMQFVLLSRLKPDLCKSPGKLLKDFVCSSSRQVFISKAIFCLYYPGYIFWWHFSAFFLFIYVIFSAFFYTSEENIY